MSPRVIAVTKTIQSQSLLSRVTGQLSHSRRKWSHLHHRIWLLHHTKHTSHISSCAVLKSFTRKCTGYTQDNLSEAEETIQKLGEKYIAKVYRDVIKKPGYVPPLCVLQAVSQVRQTQMSQVLKDQVARNSRIRSCEGRSSCSKAKPDQEATSRRTTEIISKKISTATRRYLYLQSVQTLRAAGYPVIYLDEAWFSHPSLARRKGILSCKQRERVKRTSIPRLLTICAGDKSNFIPGTLLVKHLEHSREFSRRHSGIDKNVFNDYIHRQLLPNIPENSVIVMDNASFHGQHNIPSNNSNEYENSGRVRPRNAPIFPPSLEQLQVQAAELCDGLMSHLNHRCVFLRLPPYHTCLNPIELAWNDVRTLLQYDREVQEAQNGEEFEIFLRVNLKRLMEEERWMWYMCKVMAIERRLIQAEVKL